LRKLIGLDPGNVTFNEVNAKRQCQDRDYDHEPVAMFAEDFEHGMEILEKGDTLEYRRKRANDG